jgi:uncharacterized repeat protein (TIGR01451 family)
MSLCKRILRLVFIFAAICLSCLQFSLAEIGSPITLTKSVDQNMVSPGTTVTYYFAVANVGNIFLVNIQIVDPLCSPAIFSHEQSGNGNSDFDPGDVWIYTCSKVITEDITNTAYATAYYPESESPIESNSSSVTVRVLIPSPTPTPLPQQTPVCSKVNNFEKQFGADGSIYSLKKLTDRVTRKILRTSKKNSSITAAKDAMKKVNSLYVASWVTLWTQIPESSTVCNSGGSSINCIKSSSVSQKAQVSSSANTINGLIISLSKLLNKEFPSTANFTKKINKSSLRLVSNINSALSEIPNESENCY